MKFSDIEEVATIKKRIIEINLLIDSIDDTGCYKGAIIIPMKVNRKMSSISLNAKLFKRQLIEQVSLLKEHLKELGVSDG